MADRLRPDSFDLDCPGRRERERLRPDLSRRERLKLDQNRRRLDDVGGLIADEYNRQGAGQPPGAQPGPHVAHEKAPSEVDRPETPRGLDPQNLCKWVKFLPGSRPSARQRGVIKLVA